MQRVSDEQFNIMIDYMEKYRELYYGKITPAFTAKVKQDLWAELAQKLNSTESGCKRPVEKWIKVIPLVLYTKKYFAEIMLLLSKDA